jgi:uncharacterized membrane protein
LKAVGGYFEQHWSVNPWYVAEFKEFPNHPVSRGLKPFAINDEWYYHMRFVPPSNESKRTEILVCVPPDSTRERPDGPHSNNPTVRENKGRAGCVCWGFENNCTRKISNKDPLQIVVIKGFGSGFGALTIAFAVGEWTYSFAYIPAVLLLGFVAYGLSVFFYVYAQREIGAAKTSAYYAIAPFIGVILSFIILGERPNFLFGIALLIMIAGAWLASKNLTLTTK